MKIRYRVEIEDLVALSLYCFRYSPRFRANRFLLFWIAPLVPSIVSVVMLASNLRNLWTSRGGEGMLPTSYLLVIAGVAVGVAAGMAIILRWRNPGVIRKRIYKRFRNGEITSLGDWQMELCNGWVSVLGASSQAKLMVSNFREVQRYGNYIFIFTTPVVAYIINTKNIAEGDAETFLLELEQEMKSSRQEPVPSASCNFGVNS